MSFAFIFPGQGSQSVGMLSELGTQFPEVKTTFQQASDTLGYDLWQLIQDGPASELNQTAITQPAMLAADVAVWRTWQAQGGTNPTVMAGHSLGEYSALVCADSLSLDNAISLVADRGRFMQEAVPEGSGAMAAILGLEDNIVIDVCENAKRGEVVSAVNFNSPGQVVIAGNTTAVERAVELAKEAGAKRAMLLPVSVPSHCQLMAAAAERLAARLASVRLSTPAIPVINNVDVQIEESADAIADALTRQLFSPVRWVETIQAIAAKNIDLVIEGGPGKVLTGLNKRIDRQMTCIAVHDSASLAQALEAINGGENNV